MRKLLRKAKFKSVPTEPKFDACKDTASPQVQKAIVDEIYKRLDGKNAKGWNQTKAKGEIRKKDASWKYSKLTGLRFLDWLDKIGTKEANRAMKEIYLYASSQTDKSSVHYKLY